MKNIFKIIRADLRHIKTNVIALCVIIGLTVIPALYSWFNILSNWDPYGQASTSRIKVAVVSVDKGTSLEGTELNVGDTIIVPSYMVKNKTRLTEQAIGALRDRFK